MRGRRGRPGAQRHSDGGGRALRPAGNAPTPAERATCAPWLDAEWRLVGSDVRVIIALGGFAWRAVLDMVRRCGARSDRQRRSSGTARRRVQPPARSRLMGCYHPSQQNTFTGKLTPAMLDDVFGSRRTLSDFGALTSLSVGSAPKSRGGTNGAPWRALTPAMRLSVLDLVPVRTDQSTSDALAATTQLAQTADRLGYTRYWVAEHHNMPSVAATSPPVLIAHLAAHTIADPARLRRRDAAQPRAAGRRRAVRSARGGASRPHRSRHRPGAGLRSGDVLALRGAGWAATNGRHRASSRSTSTMSWR